MQKALTYLQIALGTAIAALAVNLFMVPNELASGGMNGLMLVLHYLWDVPVGVTYFLANLPALVLLFKVYGWEGLARQLWGIASFSLVLDLTEPLKVYAPTENLMLATLYGGSLVGLGLGLAIRVGGSTGGTSSIAQVVRHYTGFQVSKFLLLTDLAILGFAAVMLSPEAILYGLIMTFLVTRVIQVVQEGFSTSRCMLIISERPDAVSKVILQEIKRGATRLSATGEYSHTPKPVLMCVVSETEVQRVRRQVLEADPEAFMVVTDAREVTGRGFTLDTELRRIPFWVTQREV